MSGFSAVLKDSWRIPTGTSRVSQDFWRILIRISRFSRGISGFLAAGEGSLRILEENSSFFTNPFKDSSIFLAILGILKQKKNCLRSFQISNQLFRIFCLRSIKILQTMSPYFFKIGIPPSLPPSLPPPLGFFSHTEGSWSDPGRILWDFRSLAGLHLMNYWHWMTNKSAKDKKVLETWRNSSFKGFFEGFFEGSFCWMLHTLKVECDIYQRIHSLINNVDNPVNLSRLTPPRNS